MKVRIEKCFLFLIFGQLLNVTTALGGCVDFSGTYLFEGFEKNCEYIKELNFKNPPAGATHIQGEYSNADFGNFFFRGSKIGGPPTEINLFQNECKTLSFPDPIYPKSINIEESRASLLTDEELITRKSNYIIKDIQLNEEKYSIYDVFGRFWKIPSSSDPRRINTLWTAEQKTMSKEADGSLNFEIHSWSSPTFPGHQGEHANQSYAYRCRIPAKQKPTLPTKPKKLFCTMDQYDTAYAGRKVSKLKFLKNSGWRPTCLSPTYLPFNMNEQDPTESGCGSYSDNHGAMWSIVSKIQNDGSVKVTGSAVQKGVLRSNYNQVFSLSVVLDENHTTARAEAPISIISLDNHVYQDRVEKMRIYCAFTDSI